MTDQQSPEPGKSQSNGRLLFVISLIVALGIGLLAARMIWEEESDQSNIPSASDSDAARSLREWEAPAFTLTSIDGQTVSLSDFQGRTVFLNFWGTWCEPCKREFPAFKEFMAEQPEGGPIIITINQGEDDEDVLDFIENLGISDLMVLMDYNLDLVDDYPATVLPATFVIDGTGFVRFRAYGEVTKTDLYDFLDKLAVES